MQTQTSFSHSTSTLPPQDKPNNLPQLIASSAYPQNKSVKQMSVFHKILKRSKQVTTNITMRLSNKQSDIRQIFHYQLEWFPFSYGQSFYDQILQGRSRCLVTQTELFIEECVLREILLQSYNKQNENYDQEQKKGFSQNPILLKPSSYFTQQGLHLWKPIKQTKSKQQNDDDYYLIVNYKPLQIPLPQPPILPLSESSTVLKKLRIIIGVMVFNLTISRGYLRRTWWQQNFFENPNSIYITTIGTMFQFRNNHIAYKMIEWLIERTKKDNILKFIFLHVIQYNIPAIKLYEKFQFKQLNVCKDYYQIDGKGYNGKILGLFLNGGVRNIGWMEWIKSLWK